MPANGFSVGRDVSLQIFTPSGLIGTASLKSFEAKPIMADIKQGLITGVTLYAYLFEGWQGSFKFARFDASIDDYFANAEANYYAGAPLNAGQISETITNPDGSVSQFIYTGLALKLDSAGPWSGNAEVNQDVSWMASRRQGL